VIDVNSGKNLKVESQEENALVTNLAATEEIAVQTRLRDLGGIIIIDFIDMKKRENKKMVYEKIKELMSHDRAKHKVYPLTQVGLMQITRQRLRAEKKIEVQENCPSCGGTGKINASILIVDEIEQKITEIVESTQIKKIIIKLHSYLSAYLTKGIMSIRWNWQKKYKIRIKIIEDTTLEFMDYMIYDEAGDEIEI